MADEFAAKTSSASTQRSEGAPSLQKPPQNADYSQDIQRSLPTSEQAEKTILASMAHMPQELISLAIEKLRPHHFYNPAHQKIFETLIELHDENKPIDLITVTQILMDRNSLDQAGGPGFLTEIFTAEPPAAHFEYHIGIVKEKYTLRSIIQTCTQATGRAYDDQEDVAGLLDQVEHEILAIREGQAARESFTTMKEEVMQTVQYIEEVYEDRSKALGLATGFKYLDGMTNGLHGGEMIIIAARPSMGKTALAMNIIENVGVEQGKPAAVFSLEMSSQQLVQRLLCSRAAIRMQDLRGGFLKKSDFPKLMAEAGNLANSPIFIDDSGDLNIMDLRHKARRLKKMADIQIIAIDYLQLVKPRERRSSDNRQVEVADISSGIKALAKELNIPIIVLAQLNRNPDAREGGRPRLSDLRESGSIEQDADVVGLLWRKAYYSDKKDGDDDNEQPEDDGRSELLIAKQRNGPTGNVKLTFLKERMRFVDRAPGDDDDDDDF